MSDSANVDAPPEAQEPEVPVATRRRRRNPLRAVAKGLLVLFVTLSVALGGIILFLDTGPGHRFIVDRIAALTPKSGLRIRIGRIEGSIWGRTTLRDVRLYDPDGLFAESPAMELDWTPAAFITNQLLIHELTSDLVILHRLPELIPDEEPGPILPEYDIHIGRLAVREMRFGAPITGRERVAALAGEVEIRSGRALLNLRAEVRDGGDRLVLRLDAQPDRDRFDIEARLAAPADSVVGALLGTRRPIQLDIAGDGSWTRWRGAGRLDLSGQQAAQFRIGADAGTYRLQGWAAPAQFLQGKLARLTTPRVAIQAQGTLDEKIFEGAVSARSPALRMEARGGVDLARNRYRDVRIAADLLRPAALFSNMTGRNVRMTALLDGSFNRAAFAYRLTAPRIAFDQTGFEDVRAEGRGTWTRAPVIVPIVATSSRVTGVGEVVGGILSNLRVGGALRVTPQRLLGDGLELRSDRLRGQMGLAVGLRTGRYAVTLNGGMDRYPVPGFGLVDVRSELLAVPGSGGRGTMVTGTARSQVRRLDNSFLRWVAGGLPQLQSGIVRGPDGIIRFNDLRITAPKLQLAGNGYRRQDGTFFFEGGGRHGDYGPVRLTLDGQIDRPRLALRLARPMESLGLADVLLNLDPSAEGFAYRAEGQSALGPFTSRGNILLPGGEPATIQVASLDVSGTEASGALRADPGGFTGRLQLAGGGISGQLLFNPVNEVQRIEAHLIADQASFSGPPPIQIRSGRLDGVMLLDPAGTSIEGSLSARGVSRGGLSIASVESRASLRGGVGQVRTDIAGSRGRNFAFNTVADVAPGRIRLSGSGQVDRRPIALTTPALLTREGDGWRLAPTGLSFAGGNATLSGVLADQRTELDARLEAMPLAVLDIGWPELGLGGIASGILRYRQAGAALPTGEADLRVRGLTRAGLVLSSRPVDVGIAARLDGVNAAMRAVAVSEGRTIGRAQARVSPISGGGSLFERIARAPLFAQIRYNGAADTLWRLTGIELIDLSGPAALGADIRGSFNNPVIRGSLRTSSARLESAVTGMVVDNLESVGVFDGSRLVVRSFRGRTERGGLVSGSGTFDLAADAGVPMNVDVRAENAQLLDRDDIRAQVTGDLNIRSDGDGGLISGDVRLNSGDFRLGTLTPAAQVARLDVRELNRPDADILPVRRQVAPWRLALDVTGGDLTVTGLGISSIWSTDLRVSGTVTEPRITGEAELVRGSYDFAGRRFDLTRGTIRFRGETPVNPELDIVAEGGARGLNAQIRVTGRSERPEIAFTSTPALPQDELLSRLLFGTSITNLSAPEALQLAAAVAALNDPTGGLNPINAVRQAVGLDRLRILPADVTQGIGTSVAAGKYLGRRVYVEVVTDAQGYTATIVEYQLTRWLSLLSSVSTIGRHSVNVRVSRDY